MADNIVLYQKEDHVGIITLNRPERLNAITDALLQNFIQKLETAREDRDVSSVILTGAGRSFCAGEDLKETSLGKSMDQWTAEIDKLQEVQRAVLRLGKPLVAAIRGYAVGGGLEFALSCDIRIAARDARFGFPETGVGLTVTTAGTKLITQIIGLGKAKEMIFTGKFVGAEEAQRIGLVNAVVPDDQLMEEAFTVCRKINERSALALKLSRIALDQGLHSSFEQTLEIEASHMLACVNSDDQRARVNQKLDRISQR